MKWILGELTKSLPQRRRILEPEPVPKRLLLAVGVAVVVGKDQNIAKGIYKVLQIFYPFKDIREYF